MRLHQLRFLSLATGAAFIALLINCSASDSKLNGSSSNSDDDSSAANNNQGGMGGIDFAGSGGTDVPACTELTCVGNTPQGNCDGSLAIDSGDAMDGARAIGLCQVAQPDTWGVVSAEWVRSDGQPLVGGDGGLFGDGTDLTKGRGILNDFGSSVVPREGGQLLALSSGSARNPDEPDYLDPGGNWKDSNPHGSPAGYPKESPSCPGVTTGDPYDSAGLRLTLLTPTDANSFTFEFNFFTYEYPDFVCDIYNDFFVAMLTPVPGGLPDGNISFDSMGNTISVNAGFLQACQPCMTGMKDFDCPLGYSELLGTGFDTNTGGVCPIQGSAGTSWLVTTAPIENPGSEITLQFAVWDSGDGVLDSTVLIDNFRFELEGGEVGTIPVPD